MSESEFVVVHTAKNHTEAKLLAGLLETEGIRTTVNGTELSDEFAMSKQLAGLGEVVVHRSHLEKALDIVAAWKAGPGGGGAGGEGGD